MTVAHAIWTDRSFRVMGTDARIFVVGGPEDLAARGEALARDLEARWTRFDRGSELMRLNAGAGAPVRVSEPTFAVVARAVDAWWRTAGRFDPTGLDALVASGHDRDFASVGDPAPGRAVSRAAEPSPARLQACRVLVLDPLVAAVTLPHAVQLALGG